jgi:hypothetical protein
MTEDIKVDITPPSTTGSRDDDNRKELLWELREEELLEKWKDEMYDNSKLHRNSGKKYKNLYAIFGVPATLIPIIMSGLTAPLEDYPLTQSLLMITTGTLVGISTFFNLGKRFAKHFEYENRYDELAREIEKELKKPKRHRLACDVYMERVYLKYSGLNACAPVIGSPNQITRKIIE